MEPHLDSVFVANSSNGSINKVHVFGKNDGKFLRNLTIKEGAGAGLGARGVHAQRAAAAGAVPGH